MIVREAMIFRQVADLSAHVGKAGRLVEKAGLTGSQAGNAEQDFDEGGFACAILAKQSKDLAALGSEGDASECLDAIKLFDEQARFDGRH
jgi:hypothetical protein